MKFYEQIQLSKKGQLLKFLNISAYNKYENVHIYILQVIIITYLCTHTAD